MTRLPAIGDAVRVRVEIPKGSLVKRRADGHVDFVSPLPCPFDYGSLPDTVSADGDPIDALLVGRPQGRAVGAEVDSRVLAVVRFVDAGRDDPKLVCGATLTVAERRELARFFRLYARLKHVLNRLRGGRGATFVSAIDG